MLEYEGYLSDYQRWKFSAEFTTTLSERNYVPTFTYWSLKVTSTDEGVSITNDNILIDDTDIPARNGVIHAIPDIIQPFTDRQLERFCPGITATMEPTTPPIVVEPEATPDPDGIPGGSGGGIVVPPEAVGC